MKQLLLVFIVLALASLACTIGIGGPQSPYEEVPVSLEDAQSLQAQFEQAMKQGTSSGVVSFVVTERQLTSALAFRLAADAENALLTNPQVYLRDGQIQIYGTAQQGSFSAGVRILITATVNESGTPVLSVQSVDLGPLPAPEGLNSAITAMVSEAFTGAMGPVAIGFRMERITIENGQMLVQGRIK
jgi:uncharacterized protein YpmS